MLATTAPDRADASASSHSPFSEYSPTEHRPLAGYATIVAAFGAAVTTTVAVVRAAGLQAPKRIAAGDVVLMGVATHKLSRLIAKDKVTSFVRAPFTRFQEPSGHGEVCEEPRGHGLRLAIGELLLCPYCLAGWVAAGFFTGLVAAPRATRLVAATFTAETVADFLQLSYLAAEKRA